MSCADDNQTMSSSSFPPSGCCVCLLYTFSHMETLVLLAHTDINSVMHPAIFCYFKMIDENASFCCCLSYWKSHSPTTAFPSLVIISVSLVLLQITFASMINFWFLLYEDTTASVHSAEMLRMVPLCL